jgi:hypothetical protein
VEPYYRPASGPSPRFAGPSLTPPDVGVFAREVRLVGRSNGVAFPNFSTELRKYLPTARYLSVDDTNISNWRSLPDLEIQCLSRQRQSVGRDATTSRKVAGCREVDGRPAAQNNCGARLEALPLEEVLRDGNRRLLASRYTTLGGLEYRVSAAKESGWSGHSLRHVTSAVCWH